MIGEIGRGWNELEILEEAERSWKTLEEAVRELVKLWKTGREEERLAKNWGGWESREDAGAGHERMRKGSKGWERQE